MQQTSEFSQANSGIVYLQPQFLHSPRNLSVEAKNIQNQHFNIKSKEFGDVISECGTVYNALVRLTKKLFVSGKGSVLIWDEDGRGNYTTFEYKNLVSAFRTFKRILSTLKKFYRGSRRRPVKEGETLKSMLTPIYFETENNALYEFLTSDRDAFPTVAPNSNDTIISQLPGLRSGYCLRQTATSLFYLHIFRQGLSDPNNGQYIASSQLMDRTFGNVSAKYFAYDNGQGKTEGGVKKVKIEKVPALTYTNAQGTPVPSTYQIITDIYQGKKTRPAGKDKPIENADFNTRRFKTFHFQIMLSLNCYTRKGLDSLLTLNLVDPDVYGPAVQRLQDNELLQQVKAESDMVKRFRENWSQELQGEKDRRARDRKVSGKKVKVTRNKKDDRLRNKLAREELSNKINTGISTR